MNNSKRNWVERLKSRWNLSSVGDVVIVLIVFAFTGTTVLVIKPYLLTGIFGSENLTGWHSVIYYIFILPLYNILLLIYGFIFGKFHFFWKFEQRFFNRILKSKKRNNS